MHGYLAYILLGTTLACALTVVSASTGGIVALGYPKMQRDLHSTDEQDALVLAMYALGCVVHRSPET